MAAKKTSKKVSFADAVRKAMSAHAPQYRFTDTSGGSGPLVRFERPHKTKAKNGLLVEVVMFQKGLHGADWFRVNFFPSFEAPAAIGTTSHALWEGATLGKDVSWKTTDELTDALDVACAALEKKAQTFFVPFEKETPKLDVLLGSLVSLYVDWLETVGSKLPMDQFKDDDGGKLPAYESFRKWLDAKKLTKGFKGDLDTCLWRFWHGARPMREIDYDKSDYYDCTKCGAFVRRARATLTKHKVPGFGVHYALVCNKH
jgi:hypothetical protein